MGPDSQRSLSSYRNESIQPDELTLLLTKLHAPETPIESPDEYATVAAVCEATGCSAQRVWEVLEEIRQQDLEARVEQRLREAEEPLYRVERPGTYFDPLDSTTNVLARRRAVKTVLDRIPKADRVGPDPHHQRRVEEDKSAAVTSRFAGNIVLIATLLIFLVAVGFAVVSAMQLR